MFTISNDGKADIPYIQLCSNIRFKINSCLVNKIQATEEAICVLAICVFPHSKLLKLSINNKLFIEIN